MVRFVCVQKVSPYGDVEVQKLGPSNIFKVNGQRFKPFKGVDIPFEGSFSGIDIFLSS